MRLAFCAWWMGVGVLAAVLSLSSPCKARAHTGVLVGPDAFASTLSDQTQYIWPANTVAVGGCAGTLKTEPLGRLERPEALAVAPDGRSIYVVEPTRHRVLRVRPDNATITLFAGGNGPGDRVNPASRLDTQLDHPSGIAVSSDSEYVYVTDQENRRLLRFHVRSFAVTVFELKNPAQGQDSSSRVIPSGVVSSPDDSEVFVADSWNHQILSIDPSGQRPIETVAGDLSQLSERDRAKLRESDPHALEVGGPSGLTISPDGRYLYALDDMNDEVIRIDRSGSKSERFSDLDLSQPKGIAVSPIDGSVFVADTLHDRVIRIDPVTKQPSIVLLGDAQMGENTAKPGQQFLLAKPSGIAIGPDGSALVADSKHDRILLIGASGEFEDTLAAGVARRAPRAELLQLVPRQERSSAAVFHRLRVRLAMSLIEQARCKETGWCNIL